MEWFRQQIGDFHPLALADVPQLARFLRASKERSCEFSVANLYLWSFSYHVRWLVDDNRLYLHTENREEPEDALMVVVPEKVPDPPAKELLAFSEEMRKHGHTGRFQQLRENFVMNCPELSKWFEIQPMDEEVAEYVYRLDNLATLAGERYSKKRNLVKQFARGFPAATSRPLDDSDLPAVLAMSSITAAAAAAQVSPARRPRKAVQVATAGQATSRALLSIMLAVAVADTAVPDRQALTSLAARVAAEVAAIVHCRLVTPTSTAAAVAAEAISTAGPATVVVVLLLCELQHL